jgi:hypothetical protein
MRKGLADKADIKNILTYGDVDFDKSNIPAEGGKKYVIYGQNTKEKKITLEVINYSDKAVLKNIIETKE